MQHNHKTPWYDLTTLKPPICSVLFRSPTLSALMGFPLSTSGTPCPCSKWIINFWVRMGSGTWDSPGVQGQTGDCGCREQFHLSPTVGKGGGWKNKKENQRERSCIRLIWGALCYHGYNDCLIIPSSCGSSEEALQKTCIAPGQITDRRFISHPWVCTHPFPGLLLP